MADEKQKIAYIDPNNLAGFDKETKAFGDNVTWKPEDLNFSVDIQVVVPDRNNCGVIDYADWDRNLLIHKPFLSFFAGQPLKTDEEGKESEFFLTDSYTNISYTEIKNSRVGNRELLGVESIDIEFNSHYFPIVTIKFIDVRGASLMMPEEESYYGRMQNNEAKENVSDGCRNFFRALFHFPYPVFFLTVKGFYGTRETFLLSVEEFKTTFNQQTGNFDVTIRFIGHMYGVYSDLPLNYLIIAPYVGGSNNSPNSYWTENQKTSSSKFMFEDGTPIPTFIEFLEKYRNLDSSFTKALDMDNESYNRVKNLIQLRERRALLEKILNAEKEYEAYLISLFTTNDSKVFSRGGQDYILLLKSNNESVKVSRESYEQIIKDYQTYLEKSNFEKINGDECLSFFKRNTNTTVAAQQVTVAGKKVYVIKQDRTTYNEFPVFNDVKTDNDLIFIEDGMIEAINSGKRFAVIYRKFTNEGGFFANIKKKIDELSESIDTEITDNNETYNEVVKIALGFSPTIENVFRMIYAHIDCYMHEFYETLGNVLTESDKRFNTTLTPKVDIINNTDVETSENRIKLPAFTGFYKKDPKTGQRTKVYPFEYKKDGTKEPLAEVRFVEKIYEGINGLSDIYNKTKPESERAPLDKELSQKFIPLTPLDIIYDGENPYLYLHAEERQELLNEIIRMFVYRIASAIETKTVRYKNGKFTDNDKKKIDVVKNEAKNIIDALGKIPKRILLYELTNYRTYSGDFYKQLPQIKDALTEDPQYDIEILTKNVSDFRRLLGAVVGTNTKNPSFFSDVKFTVKNAKNLHSNVKDMREGNKTGEDISETLENFEGIKTTNYMSKLSERNINTYFNTERWTYYKPDYTYTGLWKYDKEHDRANVVNQGNYSEFCNNVLENANNRTRDDARFLILPMNKIEYIKGLPSGDKIKNLYFEDIMKNETNPYKRAEMFLSCLIGTCYPFGNTFAKFKNMSGIIKLPKFLRLFIGSQLHSGKFSVDKSGTFTGYRNCTDKFNGEDLSFYDTIMEQTKDEFENWAITDFKKIDAVLTEYSTPEYTQPSKLNFYKCDVNVLHETLIDFYLSYNPAVYISLYEKDNFDIEYNTIIDLTNELYKLLKDDIEANGKVEEEEEKAVNEVTEEESDRLKEEIYYTQKGLYDKWLSIFREDRFWLKSPEEDKRIRLEKSLGNSVPDKVSEYNNFVFLDSFYNDIGQTFFINAKVLYDKLIQQIGEAEVRTNRSVLEFMSDIAQEHKLLFIALPVYNNFRNQAMLEDIFTPHSVYDGSGSGGYREIGNTYILMYTHEVSHNVSPSEGAQNGSQFSDDGIDIGDTLGKITAECTEFFCTGSLEKYVMPAFGVTFGRQNQQYFKSISVNMENPRQTDFSIYNMFELAGQEKNGNVNSPVTVGQNMFSIYSNRAYDCNVEMMGCVNIMPTMYFQLNNIPLFKGAYMITKVEHHIKAGDITTKFSGTRISKNAIPYLKTPLNIEKMVERISGGVKSEEGEVVIQQAAETNENTGMMSENPKVSKYFTLMEFLRSAKADSLGIKAQYHPSNEIINNIRKTALFLDKLRDYLSEKYKSDFPILINSGYRSAELNAVLKGSSSTSAHLDGLAVDIQPGKAGVTIEKFKEDVDKYCSKQIKEYNSKKQPIWVANANRFDQCLLESNSSGSEWVHIGVARTTGPQRGEIKQLYVS